MVMLLRGREIRVICMRIILLVFGFGILASQLSAIMGQTNLPSGTVFSDCEGCPQVVVIPAGEFIMGSPDGDDISDRDEHPQHQVTVSRAFAIGRFEVTAAEMRFFAQETRGKISRAIEIELFYIYQQQFEDSPSAETVENINFPAVVYEWEMAQAYVAWLSERTGHTYRLPTEAEWEYAARGGTTTPYYWGTTASHEFGNYDGEGFRDDFPDGASPVVWFPPNNFGLYDMGGNVWEWTQDCWKGSYNDTPRDGSSQLSGVCNQRVTRGGSWDSSAGALRSANRSYGRLNHPGGIFTQGFRVQRELN